MGKEKRTPRNRLADNTRRLAKPVNKSAPVLSQTRALVVRNVAALLALLFRNVLVPHVHIFLIDTVQR